ncbi:MAG TPA: TetR/AcrR family transcriptional regulator C-terminal domain-containing protein [Streptosporangiaceae bacterium]|jgi:AcrR family transcriptional regulator|nr:TetR/AcrR family transcriptional regulator C-terminal domain-containing protein [Streptosporangiaceae bacterium]
MTSPREPLTRDRIIDTALHIVDGQGLGRLTMRRLGDALQVEAMAIYHHLPRGKEELLDGLIAHVAALPAAWPRPANGTRPAAGDWRAHLRSWGGAYRARLLDHAGVLPLLMTRRNPTALAETTASLREVLRMAGFLDAAAATGAHTILGYVIGHAALEARATAARRPDEPEEAVDWDHRFAAGLDVVLAGLLTLP